eukprot:gene9759-10793_t
MDAKESLRAESKESSSKGDRGQKGDSHGLGRYVDDSLFGDSKAEGKAAQEEEAPNFPRVDILQLSIQPEGVVDISAPLSLDIRFDLDRDVVAANWVVQFLVDSCHRRIVRTLGETPIEDYPDGESEMHFEVAKVDVEGIAPSALTNAGLLMAKFVVDGEEVCSVNMVVQVCEKGERILREILSPLD